ncbi:unnamed protein product [Paramecium primaurelia]|uniref:Uncharacterized protein n=2 Tax=Paramecium TaxID=5884 RepID=A0A8S1X3R8_9CILI|nr:unnamed protein product [Paramecium primaurelia]CAD8195597.1 unnamed protein product [Paramecium pentaurelia]
MHQELQKLEQLNSQELELVKQVYEQKVVYLNTKIYMLSKELEQKTSEVSKIKRSQIVVQEDPIQEDNLIEIERAKTQDLIKETKEQMEQELLELKSQYSKELFELQKQLRKRDLMIEQLMIEIQMYKNCQNQNLDKMKVEYLSQLIEIVQDIQIQIQQ